MLLHNSAYRGAASAAQLRLEFLPEPRAPRRLVVLKDRDIAPRTVVTLEV